MPNVSETYADALRGHVDSVAQAVRNTSGEAQAELFKLRRTRFWVVVASGVVALGAGFGLGAALGPRGDGYE